MELVKVHAGPDTTVIHKTWNQLTETQKKKSLFTEYGSHNADCFEILTPTYNSFIQCL